jgi:LAO/AO transport system kinase
LVVVNKADIDPDAATRAQAQITSALRLFTQHGRDPGLAQGLAHWTPRVIQISALKGAGLDTFWEAVTRFRDLRTADGALAARRRQQALAWMWERIESGLRHEFRRHPAVQALLPQLTGEVEAGRMPPSAAARQLLQARLNP